MTTLSKCLSRLCPTESQLFNKKIFATNTWQAANHACFIKITLQISPANYFANTFSINCFASLHFFFGINFVFVVFFCRCYFFIKFFFRCSAHYGFVRFWCKTFNINRFLICSNSFFVGFNTMKWIYCRQCAYFQYKILLFALLFIKFPARFIALQCFMHFSFHFNSRSKKNVSHMCR